MSIPLRGIVASATIMCALSALAAPAHADSHRGAPTRPPVHREAARRTPARGLHSPYAREIFERRVSRTATFAQRRIVLETWQRKAARAVKFAYRQRGRPYVWGGTGAGGYDCSGLVQRSWRHAGVTIPRVAAAQYHGIRKHVPRSRLRPGDLVFFDGLGHVGMYVGHGKFIHSPHTGSHVQVVRFNSYWRAHFVGAARPGWPRLLRF